MSVFVLCDCPDGFGAAHDHLPPRFILRHPDGREIRPPGLLPGSNFDPWQVVGEEPESIRVAIPWKELARSLMRPSVGVSVPDPATPEERT